MSIEDIWKILTCPVLNICWWCENSLNHLGWNIDKILQLLSHPREFSPYEARNECIFPNSRLPENTHPALPAPPQGASLPFPLNTFSKPHPCYHFDFLSSFSLHHHHTIILLSPSCNSLSGQSDFSHQWFLQVAVVRLPGLPACQSRKDCLIDCCARWCWVVLRAPRKQ